MKKVYVFFGMLLCSTGVFSQTLFDSFTDGDFTAAPVWGGITTSWGIVANSDVAAGVTGSNTLRLAAPAVAGTEYLSSQISAWGVSQEWGFFLGRRGQAATASNQSYFWLYANESTLTSATVDGYRIAFGDDVGADNIRLEYIVNGVVSATLITSPNTVAGTTVNGITDYGFLVRVTRSATGAWEIFTSTLPQVTGAGAIATDIPNAANANVSQGTVIENSVVPATNGYVGIAAAHTTGAAAIIGQEFDQIYFTQVAGGSPTINVTPTSLTGFLSLAGVPTVEQTYTVDGSNLTNDIIITPPVGFEIATVTGGPYTVNPASITLTQTAGNVPSTTIYVRMNSATLGVNSGNITHTSTGSNDPNVALTGNVLDAEPTVQSAITFGAITNSTIQVNFTGGNGAHRILVAKALTAVSSDPADGTTYTGNSVFGAGSNLGAGNFAVYTGNLNTVLVSGLTAGTTYHFAVYEYNDGAVAGAENYLLPGGIGNETTIDVPVTYTWIGGSSTWNTAINWAPARLFPATNDILLFLDGTTETVTAVPNESIGQLHVTLGTNVTLQAAVTTTVLTINGTIALDDLTVDATSALNIGGANGYIINLATGTTGVIDGSISLTGTGSSVHKLTAADANGITFNTGSKFTAGLGLTGNPFGTGTTGSVIFTNGAEMDQASGSNPFATAGGVVTFQTGSLYKIINSGFTPSYSGRTYANLEIDAPGFSASSTGGSPLSIDNLTMTNGTQNLNLTGGISIKGNISIAPGTTLGFVPGVAGNVLTLNGTTAQSIINSGTFTYGPNVSLTINNAAGVTLNNNITLGATTTLTLTSGILKLTPSATTITLSAGTALVGGNSNASYVDGKVRKIGNTNFTFPVGRTGFGYVPIGISNFVGGSATDEFLAEYMRGNSRLLGPINPLSLLDHVSGCDYWILDRTNGTPTVDVTCYWSANNTCFGPYIDNLADLAIGHFDGAEWNSSSVGLNPFPNGTVAAGDITWPGVTTFSPFSLGSSSINNPLPITINYFNGIKQNGNHLLNWKVTCTSTPFATIEMERSIDGRNYSSIYSIYATALRCQQPFDYTDASPVAGVNYYRLKMTDANGKITYSSTVSLLNASKGIDILSIAPNPIVGGKFDLRVSAAQKTQMDIIITDMQGRVMQKRTVSMIAGFNAIPVNVRQFAAGTYQVYGTTADGRSKVLRFVVQ